MNRLTIAILLFPLAFVNCNKRNEKKIKTFMIPTVLQEQTKGPIRLFKVDSLCEAKYWFCGKYKFTDTLKLGKYWNIDTGYSKDFIHDYRRPSVDDTLTNDGFQIFVDYKTTIINNTISGLGNCCFPVYVVNETSRTKIFNGIGRAVFGIQEAIDTSKIKWGKWRPIESKEFVFCGVGYYGLKVHPGEFVMFLVPKYEGNEKQFLRIRLQIGEIIYLSQSYEGTFNANQFEMIKNSSTYYLLNHEKVSAIQIRFYGAIPKGYDD